MPSPSRCRIRTGWRRARSASISRPRRSPSRRSSCAPPRPSRRRRGRPRGRTRRSSARRRRRRRRRRSRRRGCAPSAAKPKRPGDHHRDDPEDQVVHVDAAVAYHVARPPGTLRLRISRVLMRMKANEPTNPTRTRKTPWRSWSTRWWFQKSARSRQRQRRAHAASAAGPVEPSLEAGAVRRGVDQVEREQHDRDREDGRGGDVADRLADPGGEQAVAEESVDAVDDERR